MRFGNYRPLTYFLVSTKQHDSSQHDVLEHLNQKLGQPEHDYRVAI